MLASSSSGGGCFDPVYDSLYLPLLATKIIIKLLGNGQLLRINRLEVGAGWSYHSARLNEIFVAISIVGNTPTPHVVGRIRGSEWLVWGGGWS